MRHHQADETDWADGGGRRTAQQRDGDHRDDLSQHHACAERDSQVFPHADGIQRPGDEQRQEAAEQNGGGGNRQRGQRADIQRAGLPEAQLVEGLRIYQRQPGGDAEQHRADRHAGQRQPHRVDTSARQRADQVDQQGGEGGTDEGVGHIAFGGGRAENMMPMTTAKLAPALMPSTPGSASGLRVNA